MTGEKLSKYRSDMKHPYSGEYVCEVCQKEWPTQAHLDRHSLVHTGKKPFSCTKCDATFYILGNLLLHFKRLHGEEDAVEIGKKPFSCTKCDYRCNLKGNLLLHFKRIHGEDAMEIAHLIENSVKMMVTVIEKPKTGTSNSEGGEKDAMVKKAGESAISEEAMAVEADGQEKDSPFVPTLRKSGRVMKRTFKAAASESEQKTSVTPSPTPFKS